MRKNIVQLILVYRSKNDVTCYKNWDKFQLSQKDDCLHLAIDDIDINIGAGITLEVKNIYPDENVKDYVTVKYDTPEQYLCRLVEYGEQRLNKLQNPEEAFMLVKSFLLPPGVYY